MPKKVPWNVILEIVERFPEGTSLEEIMLLAPSVPRRTIQRWLSTLVKNGQLLALGNARARRYKIALVLHEEPAPPLTRIPLSQKGARIYAAVSQPIQLRHPIGYHRQFLEDYQPNVTYYLSEELRKKLHDLGTVDGKTPAGTYARQIFQRLLIDLSWNSSRLEGNTYSLLETEQLLSSGKTPKGKDLKETQMILNHKTAIEFIVNSVEEIGVNRFTILNLHTLLSDNLLPDPAACGRLRIIAVGIAKSVYRPPAIPQVIEECFELLIDKAAKIKDSLEQAFFLLVQLPYLQPFDDVNKRTSRLAANIPLIQKNLCPLSFIDVPEEIYISGLLAIYELNRIELMRDLFIWAYERSCALYSSTRRTLGEPDPFRMQYRNAIQETVQEIVRGHLNKVKAIAVIRHHADAIDSADRPHFIETVERELQGLHEGNIARYQLRPMEYQNWKTSWQ